MAGLADKITHRELDGGVLRADFSQGVTGYDRN